MSSATTPTAKAGSTTLALMFLGLLAAIQSADPGITATALISAGKDLKFGGLDGLAATVSTLMLAATVISTGMMADHWGRKKVLIAALLLTAVGDGLVAAAQSPWMFIGGRAITGMALGAVFGAAFAYVKHFGENRPGGVAAALGVFGSAAGLFTLLIVFTGSSLVGVDWRVAFMLIPSLAVLAILIGLFILPHDDSSDAGKQKWDAFGQVLLALAVVLTLFGISHATDSLTSISTVGPFVVGLVLFVVFYLRARKIADRSFFPIGLLKQPLFLSAIAIAFVFNFATSSSYLSFSNLFQYQLSLKGLGLSLSQLPFIVMGIPVSLLIGRVLGKKLITRQMTGLIGGVTIAVGALLFAFTAMSSPHSVLDYLPALIVTGIGISIPTVAYGGMVLEEADPQHYGVVSSSRATIGQFWYSLGLAISTVLIDSIARAHVHTKLGATGSTQLDSWAASGAKPSDPSVLPAAIDGFVQGFSVMMIVLAVVAVLGGIIVVILGNKADKLRLANASA